ncbi:MAG: hypothetical protein LBF72_01905 [Holosporales bacterium]|jgi:uncharacterized phage infection (PIP) family protein YhgE|nr:hypothetical protein [Holosporales bacterium]
MKRVLCGIAIFAAMVTSCGASERPDQQQGDEANTGRSVERLPEGNRLGFIELERLLRGAAVDLGRNIAAELRGNIADGFAETNANLHQVIATVQGLENGQEALNRRLEDLNSRVEALTTHSDQQAEDVRKQIDELTQQIADTKQQVEHLAASSADQANEARERLNAIDSQLEELAGQANGTNSRLDGLAEQVVGTNGRLESLAEQVVGTNGRLDGLAEQSDTTNSTIKTLAENVAKRNAELEQKGAVTVKLTYWAVVVTAALFSGGLVSKAVIVTGGVVLYETACSYGEKALAFANRAYSRIHEMYSFMCNPLGGNKTVKEKEE